ncbi:MAG: 1-acyl-sn-glycerol-3-phosphate acyltransferase [Bacteroidales bacterium]
MNFKKIENWSLRYALLRIYVRFLHNTLFYKAVCVTGKENIPDKDPVFFAPNHQNALMDALVILCNIKRQPVFIARADIFKNRIIAKILIFLKILPAYRIRDGKENLKKNEEIFNTSVRILENKQILTLFPETTHTDLKRLQELKKGVQRIVFQAEEKNNFKLGVKIVPVGIYYSNYWNIQSVIQLNFGKPIDITPFLDIYKENPQKAMLALRDKITVELKPLMINIENKEYYEVFEFLRNFYTQKMLENLSLSNKQENRFRADQKTVELLEENYRQAPDRIKELSDKVLIYRNLLKKNNLKTWVIDRNASLTILLIKSFILVVLSPVFLYGYINNLIPYYIPKPITRKLRDRQFITSINYVSGMIFFPLFYIIQTSIIWITCKEWWIMLAYLFSLPITGMMAFKIHRQFIKVKSQLKYYFLKNKEDGKQITTLNREIYTSMNAFYANKKN